MKPITKYILLIISTGAALFVACTKQPPQGYLGNKFFYLSSPFVGVKGRVTISAAPLQVDNSSLPITVNLVALRSSSAAGKPTDALTKTYEIPIFLGEVTPADSTPELLAKKLGTAQYKPFNVNSNGGRLELSPATAFVDTGTYEFDIEVKNIRASKIIKSVAKIQINPSAPFQLIRQFANSSAPNQETVFTTQAAFTTTAVRTDGPNKIIIRFVDKNGATFNPKTGQVFPRVSTPANLRYEFKQYAPYYAEEKTDTALVYKYPDKVPNFPLYLLNNAYLVSYRIPAANNDLNVNINPEFSIRLWPTDGVPYVSGTWTITNTINFAAKLP
jgi:hypothetical protein